MNIHRSFTIIGAVASAALLRNAKTIEYYPGISTYVSENYQDRQRQEASYEWVINWGVARVGASPFRTRTKPVYCSVVIPYESL